MKKKNKMKLNHKQIKSDTPKKNKFFRLFFIRAFISVCLFFACFFGMRASEPIQEKINTALTKSTDIEALKEYAQNFVKQLQSIDIEAVFDNLSE